MLATSLTASNSLPEQREWSWRWQQGTRIVFRGAADFDSAGLGTGAMFYPVPGVAGLIGAVIAHGMVTEVSKNEQKVKLQEKADEILQAYQPTLQALRSDELMRSAFARSTLMKSGMLMQDQAAGKTWLVESVPAFFMTQDQAALILDHSVAVYAPGSKGEPAYRSTVRIVSAAHDASDAVDYWTANDGEQLKARAIGLLAESMDLISGALSEKPDSGDTREKTYKYKEGNVTRMERATLISEGCNRVVVRTLRGGLLSIPSATGNGPSCNPPSSGSQ